MDNNVALCSPLCGNGGSCSHGSGRVGASTSLGAFATFSFIVGSGRLSGRASPGAGGPFISALTPPPQCAVVARGQQLGPARRARRRAAADGGPLACVHRERRFVPEKRGGKDAGANWVVVKAQPCKCCCSIKCREQGQF
ncbi:unnamed protein product [Lampetra fluviatilis]